MSIFREKKEGNKNTEKIRKREKEKGELKRKWNSESGLTKEGQKSQLG